MTRTDACDQDYESYLMDRLVQALDLAERAASERERATHLRTCRYYRDLLGSAQPK